MFVWIHVPDALSLSLSLYFLPFFSLPTPLSLSLSLSLLPLPQDIMVFIQNLPTGQWTNDDVELLLAEAYKLKFMFADAPGHLTVIKSSTQ